MPSAGPEHQGVEARILQNRVEPFRPVAAPQHDGGEMGRVDPERLRGRGHRHQSGADPERRPRGQPRRACPGCAAGGDQRVAALIFVGGEPGPRQRMIPKVRIVGEEVAALGRQGRAADADIRHLDRAAITPPRHQQMAGLAGGEGHGPGGSDRHAPHLTGIAVDAGRQVHRQNRPPRSIHALDSEPRRAFEIACEAGAEQSIDDDDPPPGKADPPPARPLPTSLCAASAASPVSRSATPRRPRLTW